MTDIAVAARRIRVWANKNTSSAALSQLLANGARAALKEAIDAGEASERYTKWVDGVKDAEEETVKPDGLILYKFDYMAEVLKFAVEFAKLRSPRQRGLGYKGKHYSESWWIAKVSTGAPIKIERVNWSKLRNDDSYWLYNDMPYSRKIDVQFIGKRRLRYKVPPGLFDDTAAAVRKRFGKFVTAKRLYTISIPNQYVVKYGVKAGTRVDIPAVLIEPR